VVDYKRFEIKVGAVIVLIGSIHSVGDDNTYQPPAFYVKCLLIVTFVVFPPPWLFKV
jgi:hypothetical protein